jgi:hypothetical protein
MKCDVCGTILTYENEVLRCKNCLNLVKVDLQDIDIEEDKK